SYKYYRRCQCAETSKGKIRENQRAQRTVDKANAGAIAPEQQLPIAETVLAAAPTEIEVAPHRGKK
ncbi:hypothetical protein, partial [Pseudomonas viridiflava]|uniref:hypothetical protein n=1 Tax=Pseudomonas viridiflava TaxID=33069 RepID=UPI00197F5AD1